MKSPTAVTHDDMTETKKAGLALNLNFGQDA
jgi:hypothetical protein